MACLLAFILSALVAAAPASAASAKSTKKIVLIAGRKSHRPGTHEYLKSVKLLKVMLDRSPSLRGVRTEIHFNGWPEDPSTLEDADTIVTISDGQDADLFPPVPFMASEERMRLMERQVKRGCGLMTFHFSLFTAEKYGPRILEWVGGYFGWQNDKGERQWYSAIKTLESDMLLGTPDHPISRGVKPFRYKEEFYYRMRFRDSDTRLRPILRAAALDGGPVEQTVAWAVERGDGGRGFGTGIGHFHSSWRIEDYRKLIVNAIAWTAKVNIPPNGIEAAFVEDEEVNRALLTDPIRTLIVTGHDHPAHNWRETTPALVAALNSELPRFEVTVSEDPEILARGKLGQYKLVLLNYCNWERPGLSEAAKKNFVRYLNNGGGLTIVHFANGAFHRSLPKAADSDWPEYRKICRRVWDHAKGTSGHDKYGKFRVEIVNAKHPVTQNIEAFDARDELYFRQQGSEPVEVLATARSAVTKQDEPMALVYNHGKARIFQILLGHAAESIQVPGTTQFIRYGSLWVAKAK